MNGYNNEEKNNRASEMNRELFRVPNRADELNRELFSSAKGGDGENTNSAAIIESYKIASYKEDFGSDELFRPSPARRIWKAVLSCALCVIMGFFGAVVGIYALSQAGYTNSSSLLGDLIIDASGLEVHKVTVNETDLNYTGGYIDVAEKVVPSVVELVELVSDGEGGYTDKGSASGVIISEDGYIVTNEHVVNGKDKIRVTLSNGSVFLADIIGSDSLTDIAVIKIEDLPSDVKLTPATFGVSAGVKFGQSVVVVGNPMGFGLSVSTGVISCPSRDLETNGEIINVIQTDAAVSPGNSGGGMFDVYGNLVGVICAKTTGDGIEGLGYAVPVDTAKVVVNDLMTYGYVKGRPALGITIASIFDASSYNYYKEGDLSGYLFNSRYGIYIVSSMRSTEIKKGDRLIMIDGKRVTSSGMITEMLKDKAPGDTMTLTVERLTPATDDGNAIETHEVVITLFERDW